MEKYKEEMKGKLKLKEKLSPETKEIRDILSEMREDIPRGEKSK